MILIVVKWKIRPELAEEWLELSRPFSEATRAEEGNLFFEWSRSVEDPNEFVLVEGFADAQAGAAHVSTPHFAEAMKWMPDVVAERPSIIHVDAPIQGWQEMGEVSPR